jgi:hypothetical protein
MRSILRIAGLVAASLTLIGCAAYQPWGTSFIRSDGKDLNTDQLAIDRGACADTNEKLEDCMSGKGYALVTDEEASQKQKEIAENAEKKKHEEAQVAELNKKVATLLANPKTNQKAHAQPRREAAALAANANVTSQEPPSHWSSSTGDSLPALPWPSKRE